MLFAAPVEDVRVWARVRVPRVPGRQCCAHTGEGGGRAHGRDRDHVPEGWRYRFYPVLSLITL